MLLVLHTLLRDPKLYLYTLVGGLCALIDISLLLTLRAYYPDTHYLLLATVGFTVATLFNYLLCAHLVFRHSSQRSSQSKLTLTYLVSAIGLAIQLSLLYIGCEWLLLPLLISKLGAVGIAFIWNFLSRKYLVFN